MSYQRSTRYGLYAALEMARAADGRAVTAGEIADRYRLPPAALAKAIQRLVAGGVAAGTRGVAGGYRLARAPSAITVLEVVEIFEARRRPGDCLLGGCAPAGCERSAECALRGLFDEVDEQARATFASVTLATLAAPRRPLPAIAVLGGAGRRHAVIPTRSSPAASRSRRRRRG